MSFSAIAIFAATATPGGDLVSPFVLGGTMYLLYEGGIIMARIMQGMRRKDADRADDTEGSDA